MGFNGLVLTDALNMHALKEFGNPGLECLRAGADILLHPDDADVTASSILSALEDNSLDIKILDSSVDRIIQKKSAMKSPELIQLTSERQLALSEKMFQKSITLLRDAGGILPLRKGRARLILSGDNKYFGSSILTGVFYKTDIDHEDISEDDIVVIAIFTSVAAWRGSSGIVDDEKNRLNAIISKARGSVVISFGSPYVLRHFDKSDILIAAYEPTIQAQQATIDCLTGKAPFSGRLPVNLFKE